MRATRRLRFDETSIDKIFRHLDASRLPGAAVGIAIGGKPVYRKGFGLASMELPVALSPHTRMRIYSTTKHITCLAYLLFCEEGKAGMDDPIGKYLPELHSVTHRVTMRQLMSNTSGLRDACEICWFFSGTEITVPETELLALYRQIPDLNFAPGEAWSYNSGGFHILSAVIEKLADQPLEEVFRKRIFEPVGMHDTLLRRTDTDFIPNSAVMHMTAAGGEYEKRYLSGELLGEGGIVSTVDDMLLWLKHMVRPVVGRPETWALMSASHRSRDGVETGYGLGLFRCAYRGIDTISHGGGGLGNNSQMIRVPEADLDVIAMVNSDVSAGELVGKVLDVCLGIEPDTPRAPAVCITGLFRSPTTGRVIRLYAKEGAQMALIDGAECSLGLREDNVLRLDPWSLWNFGLKWTGHAERPDGIRFEIFGRSDELEPVWPMESPALESIAGDYLAEGIGVRVSIVVGRNVGHATTIGTWGSRTFRLEAIGAGRWKLKATDPAGWAGILASSADHAAVSIRAWGTREVAFQRLP